MDSALSFLRLTIALPGDRPAPSQFIEPCHRPGTDDYGRPEDMWWDNDLTDPAADDVWEDVVLATARDNTAKLEAAFDGKVCRAELLLLP